MRADTYKHMFRHLFVIIGTDSVLLKVLSYIFYASRYFNYM